jgi:hypothetical protein
MRLGVDVHLATNAPDHRDRRSRHAGAPDCGVRRSTRLADGPGERYGPVPCPEVAVRGFVTQKRWFVTPRSTRSSHAPKQATLAAQEGVRYLRTACTRPSPDPTAA